MTDFSDDNGTIRAHWPPLPKVLDGPSVMPGSNLAQRIERRPMGDDYRECEKCHECMLIDYGMEPTKLCHNCAHEEVDRLESQLARVQDERDRLRELCRTIREDSGLGDIIAAVGEEPPWWPKLLKESSNG